jgi:hypothetical protein
MESWEDWGGVKYVINSNIKPRSTVQEEKTGGESSVARECFHYREECCVAAIEHDH